MTAGLPGTGIGGLFYLLLVFWMPCKELYLLCRGRSHPQRWRAIGFYLALTATIIVTTWGEAWLLSRIITSLARALGLILPGTGQGYRLLAGASILLSLGSLVAVLIAVHVLRLGLWLNRRRSNLGAMPGSLAGPAAAA